MDGNGADAEGAVWPDPDVLCGAWFLRSWSGRCLVALLAATLLWWLPAGIVWGGVIWLFGVVAFWFGTKETIRKICRHPAWLIFAGALSLGSLAASKSNSIFGTDWSIGVAFALWVIGLASCEHPFMWLKNLATGLSETSYTLYLVHFPLLAFVFVCFFEGRKFSPDASTYLWFVGLLAMSLAYATAIWWCFERNTDAVRKRIEIFFRPKEDPQH